MEEPTAPIPFDESKDPNPWWNDPEYGGVDPFDKFLPKNKSFITDFIYATRGIETPSLFCTWSALFLLSTVIKREAWIKWYPSKFYCNLFVIFVGPAASKKSTALDEFCLPMMERLKRHIKDPNMLAVKNLRYIKDKFTPEVMLQQMKPSSKPQYIKKNGQPVQLDDGTYATYRETSECAIILSEMSVSMSKRSYAEGLVQLLLDLYTCKDEWTNQTLGRGEDKLEELFVSFLGATTTTGFRDTLPQSAVGDGFLSRNIVAYQPGYPRDRDWPEPIEHGPDFEELTRRLAWIAENTIGEYEFTAEANAAYRDWYRKFKARLRTAGDAASILSRLDGQVRKIAFLLRAARYDDNDNKVHAQDFHDAVRLVQGTYEGSVEILNELSIDGKQQIVNKVERYLKQQQEVNRRRLLRNLRVTADEANFAVNQLFQQGKVRIHYEQEKDYFIELTSAGGSGRELYTWSDDDEQRFAI